MHLNYRKANAVSYNIVKRVSLLTHRHGFWYHPSSNLSVEFSDKIHTQKKKIQKKTRVNYLFALVAPRC